MQRFIALMSMKTTLSSRLVASPTFVLIFALVVCFTGGHTVHAQESLPASTTVYTVGPAKALALPIWDFDDLQRRLLAAGDSLLIVNFWATWCKPCVEELPYFVKLDSIYRNKGVRVVLVSLDDPKDLGKKVSSFLQKKRIRVEAAVLKAGDPNVWIDKISSSWSGAIPATLFLDGKRGTRDFLEGVVTYDLLKERVDLHHAFRKGN